jgi:hypothetical protein
MIISEWAVWRAIYFPNRGSVWPRRHVLYQTEVEKVNYFIQTSIRRKPML